MLDYRNSSLLTNQSISQTKGATGLGISSNSLPYAENQLPLQASFFKKKKKKKKKIEKVVRRRAP